MRTGDTAVTTRAVWFYDEQNPDAGALRGRAVLLCSGILVQVVRVGSTTGRFLVKSREGRLAWMDEKDLEMPLLAA